MNWAAAVIAGAILFLLGLALGVRRCPEVGEVAYREDDDGIAPPDPYPGDAWARLAEFGRTRAIPGLPPDLSSRL